MNSRANTSQLAALLILGIVLAYLPALQGGYIWDDQEYVVHNSNLLSAEGLRNIWMEPRSMVMVQYYPLVQTVLWLQYRLWGLHPLGYHCVNILLHALNAVILWIVLRRMKVPGSWWIAAVFGIHPVQVESVAWITETKNTLSGFFSLSASLAYLICLDTRAGGRPDRVPAGGSQDSMIAYMLSLGFLLLALLSKPTAVAMPPTLLALTWWKSKRLRPSDILPLGPHFLLGAACGAFAWWLEAIQVGASGDEFSLSLLQRVLLAGRVIWFYPAKLVWPAELMFVYPRWSVDPLVWWQYLFPLGAVAAILSLWFLRERLGKGPLVAVLVYVIHILPVAGILHFYGMKFSFVWDHFQYLAGIGIMVLAIVPAARLIGSIGPDARAGVLASRVLPAAILMVLGSLTWGHTQIFRDEETLWRDTTAKNPSAWMPHANLGDVLIDKGDIAGAIEQYRVVLELAADDAGPFYSMGFALERQGKDQEAIRYYMQALEIEPNYGWAYYNIGEILEKQGNLADAESYYSAAVKRIPQSYWRSYKPLEKLGLLLARRGRPDQAARLLSRSLEINPRNEKLRAELHEILNRTNR